MKFGQFGLYFMYIVLAFVVAFILTNAIFLIINYFDSTFTDFNQVACFGLSFFLAIVVIITIHKDTL